MLDGKFRPNQVADNAHGQEAKLRILLGLGEFDGFLDACPAQLFQTVPFLLRGKTSYAYRHLIGEHETLDCTIKIGV